MSAKNRDNKNRWRNITVPMIINIGFMDLQRVMLDRDAVEQKRSC